MFWKVKRAGLVRQLDHFIPDVIYAVGGRQIVHGK